MNSEKIVNFFKLPIKPLVPDLPHPIRKFILAKLIGPFETIF